MSVNFKKFARAFKESANLPENRLEDGNVNWNFVDADLCLSGWDTLIGDEFYSIFDKMAEDFNLDEAAQRLEVLKTEYLGYEKKLDKS